MPQIRFDNVSFGYTDDLFKDVSFSINDHDRIGIVGNNGTGKSTLLKCIAGQIEPHTGRIICAKGIQFGFIEQGIPNHLQERTIFEVIADALPVDEKIHSSWKVDTTLDSFQAQVAIRQKPIKELSGGWQRLTLIARMVLSHPDILLFDEPTNHLDVKKILVLEQWLNEQIYDIPLICISHDRTFLNNCTNKTFFLRGTEILEYSYSFSQAKHLLNENDNASFSRRKKELQEIDRLKHSSHELRQIGVNNYSAAAIKKSIQLAERAKNIESKLTNIHVENKRSLRLSNSGIHTKKLLEITNVTISSPDGTSLFHIEQLKINQGERIVMFGENGTGKSVFLRFLQNTILLSNDESIPGVSITPSIKPFYIDQHLSYLPDKFTATDFLAQHTTLSNQKITSTLVNSGFPISLHNTRIECLSYGQRSRLAFLLLHLMEPNFYIMDEPTNHLDITGQEQLEAEILNNGASTIVVSHDRIFAKNIGTRFFTICEKKLIEIESPEKFFKAI